MFTQLHLRNFKSWRDTGPIALAPITAFFGSNSSGKSSILQSLLLVRQTTESADRNRVLDPGGGANSLVDLGTYDDIIFQHDLSSPLYFELRWSEQAPLQVVDLLQRARKKQSTLISSTELGLEATIDLNRSKSPVDRVSYRLGNAYFCLTRRGDSGYELESDSYTFVRSQGRAWSLPAPTRFYGFPDQVRLYYQNADFLSDLELKFEEACSRIHYLGPLREDPKRQYIFSGGAPGDVGRRGELAVDALVASRMAERTNSRGWQAGGRKRRRAIPLEQLVAEWLAELRLIHSFELESLDDRKTLYRVRVRRNSNSASVLLTDVGFGISQVLPVLVSLAYARDGDTLILEQPEIHLHPAVQSGLADIIIETALMRDVQVIIESHSEHLLTRLQRRIAEVHLRRGLTLRPDDISMYFCEQPGRESKIKRLEIDNLGNISNWPRDFFGNPLEDSVAMMEAAARQEER